MDFVDFFSAQDFDPSTGRVNEAFTTWFQGVFLWDLRKPPLENLDKFHVENLDNSPGKLNINILKS